MLADVAILLAVIRYGMFQFDKRLSLSSRTMRLTRPNLPHRTVPRECPELRIRANRIRTDELIFLSTLPGGAANLSTPSRRFGSLERDQRSHITWMTEVGPTQYGKPALSRASACLSNDSRDSSNGKERLWELTSVNRPVVERDRRSDYNALTQSYTQLLFCSRCDGFAWIDSGHITGTTHRWLLHR